MCMSFLLFRHPPALINPVELICQPSEHKLCLFAVLIIHNYAAEMVGKLAEYAPIYSYIEASTAKGPAVIVDICASEICAPEVCVLEVCAPEVCVLEVCAPEVCAPEICAPEVCVLEVCAPEVCALEVCALEVCAPEVCAPEVCVLEVCAPEVCAPEICVLEVCAPEVCALEVNAPKISPPPSFFPVYPLFVGFQDCIKFILRHSHGYPPLRAT